jgi:hypothetical protein
MKRKKFYIKPKVTVTDNNGIDAIFLVHAARRCLVFRLDLNTPLKRQEPMVSNGTDGIDLYFDNGTHVKIGSIGPGWNVDCSTSRYTCVVFVTKNIHEGKRIYEHND